MAIEDSHALVDRLRQPSQWSDIILYVEPYKLWPRVVQKWVKVALSDPGSPRKTLLVGGGGWGAGRGGGRSSSLPPPLVSPPDSSDPLGVSRASSPRSSVSSKEPSKLVCFISSCLRPLRPPECPSHLYQRQSLYRYFINGSLQIF